MSRSQSDPSAAADVQPLRFAFYGATGPRLMRSLLRPDKRIEPAHLQQQRDLARARQVIAPSSGRIVAQYHDVCEHDLDRRAFAVWGRRSQARALIKDLSADTFDAVVTAYGSHVFGQVSAWDVHRLLSLHRKQLWLGHIDGPLDPDNPEHELTLRIFSADHKPAKACPYRCFGIHHPSTNPG
ncbi:hypothetical protein ACFVH6_23385 [Spirillospora sp. NPDC127200]